MAAKKSKPQNKKPVAKKKAKAKAVESKLAPAKRGKGRPTLYTEEIVDLICERISTSIYGIHTICKDKNLPCYKTVFTWLNDKEKDFSQRYARAKQMQTEFMRDKIFQAAYDEKQKDTNKLKLRVDALKWTMAKLYPKEWGDKKEVTVVEKEQPLFNDPEEK